jgi:hypothetical protein
VAFLLDYAHGWDPGPFSPHAFGDHAKRPDLTLYGDHEQMLREYFWTAYHPIGARSEEPITATNEVYVPGLFGDIFDVIYAYPDVKRWTTIHTYPVVIAAGDIELTADEGKKLADYVAEGGTLLVADGQLSGPGVAALELPEMGPELEATEYRWTPTSSRPPSQRFRMKPIRGGRALATDTNGQSFCSSFDRGQGPADRAFGDARAGDRPCRDPRGGAPDRPSHARLMPSSVEGDVEWMVNRTETGWIVTLLNPAGQAKPQHGITPTDFRQNRAVSIRSRRALKSAADWLLSRGAADGSVGRTKVFLTSRLPAGGVRIVEFNSP